MGRKRIRPSDDGRYMFVGLDLHKMYTQYAVMDDVGVLLDEGRMENDPDRLRAFSDSLDNASVVMESSSTWYWVYRILSEKHEVILSNPAKTKATAWAKVKTDRIDSVMLANLLRGGYIPESYIPPRETMELRELVRYRANLVRQRSQLKNRIHTYLLMNNVTMEGKPFTKEFIEELRKVDDYRVQGYLRLIEAVSREMEDVSKVIAEKAMGNEDAKLLMTIPGISFYSALLMASEIGDVNRFQDSSSLVSYAGLSPSTHSSGGTTYHGGITKQGEPLSEVDTEPVRQGPHEGGARWDGGDVLLQAGEKEGELQGHSGCLREAPEGGLLGPQGEEGISQLGARPHPSL